MVCPRLRLVAA